MSQYSRPPVWGTHSGAPFVVIDSCTYSERRHQAIGASRGVILLVAYKMRGDNVCRIIGARRASRRERAAYTLQTGARSQT